MENYTNKPTQWQINAIGLCYIALIIILGRLVYELWPQYDANDDYKETTRFFWRQLTLTLEQRTIILVLITGAIGSFIHSAGSFIDFVGQRKIEKSWIWWYALNPFIGMSLAFVFYLVFKGGLLANTKAENLNIHGILTLSALAGLFTDRAKLKLREIFDALFQPKDNRSGKINDDVNKDFDNNNAKG